MQFTEKTKVAADILSATVVVATLLKWLPALAAMASLVYSCVMISESRRFTQLVNWLRRRGRR